MATWVVSIADSGAASSTKARRALLSVPGVEAAEPYIGPDGVTAFLVESDLATDLETMLKEAVESVGLECEVNSQNKPAPPATPTRPAAAGAIPAASTSLEKKYIATLSVSGMTCSSCVGTVERALLAMPGVKQA